MKIYDISLPISSRMLVYPKNSGVSVRSAGDFLSEIRLGSHTGTHVDAERHAWKNGRGVDSIDLKACIGPCRVLDLTRAEDAVRVSDLAKHKIRKGERILTKTGNSLRGYEKFRSDFVYLDGDAAEYLAKIGIRLYGADYLSVKQRGSSDNRPHTALLRNGIVIFEGLDLSRIKPGKYNFIGLPLRLVGLDGAPARAILYA